MSAHWVPHLIVAIDETWTRDFEPELKSLSAEWQHRSASCPSKCRRVRLCVKQMVIVMYDWYSVMVTIRVPQDTAVTGE